MSNAKNNSPDSRRQFLKTAGLGALLAVPAAAALSGRLFGAAARAQAPAGVPALVMVKESDPTAQALGYKENAAKVDVKKYPKRAGPDGKKQFCSSCTMYQAKTANPKAEPAAPCTIFAGKGVKVGGWCNLWAVRQA